MRRMVTFIGVAAVVVAMFPAVASAASSASAVGSYIVVLNSGDPGKVAAEDSRRHRAAVKHVYRHALQGYAARMSATAAARIARHPRVAYVEPDGIVTATATTQDNATWGLDRIDARSGLDGKYTYAATGSGVTAYVVDTGIRGTHSDFGGRVAAHYYDAIGDGQNGGDCNGHGTHVAGTVGGNTWGVAKAVTLVSVRVLGCDGSGTWSGVIAGLDSIVSHHAAGAPAVANMSLSGGASDSVDAAVQRVIDDGVTVVVAAGNGSRSGKEQDACNYSPARVPAAVTIGATTTSDSKTSWSNYGSCVDWFAPGASITSAWHTGDSDTNTISGTSMAAPHTAGAAALYLEQNTAASPASVRTALYDATTKGIVTSSKTANNHLLYTGTATVTNAAPTASFTHSCPDLACSFDGSGSSDPESSSLSYDWNLGDGTTQTGPVISHTYAAAGTYTVTLKVTDAGGATDTEMKNVTVGSPSSGDFTLTATGYKVKGVQHADLAWSGATSASVDVYFNGTLITTTENDGAFTHNIRRNGGGTYTYKVCEAGTTTCSNEATVVF